MRRLSEDQKWMVVSGAAAVGAAMLTRSALRAGWRLGTGRKSPRNPAAPHVTWREALVWTVATEVLVGLAMLVAERGAAAGWQRQTGKYPKALHRKRA